MIGAIVGDIVGSRFEFDNVKTKDFELFNAKCRPTDDSYMTLAIADAVLDTGGDVDRLSEATIFSMQSIGREHIDAGYGGRFYRWLLSDDPKPYNSYGNGGAMRVSPVAHVGSNIDEVMTLSHLVTAVTHNHLEGLKGAEAIAVCTYLAKSGKDKGYIRDYVDSNYYDMDFSLDDIRDDYVFHVDAMESVPQGIMAFLESDSFEDAIRNAVSIGGDSDTLGAMAGAIAEPFFGVPKGIYDLAYSYLDESTQIIIDSFESKYGNYTVNR